MYNNPYNFYPYINSLGNPTVAGNTLRAARPSLLASFSKIKWGSILNNTQKTLNVINQAIPVYYQVKPIMNNLRSFGKIMSAFNSADTKTDNISNNNPNPSTNEPIEKEDTDGLPTFFIN